MKVLSDQKLLFKVTPAKNKQEKPEKKAAYHVSFFIADTSDAQVWPTKMQIKPSAAQSVTAVAVIDIYSLNLQLPLRNPNPNQGKKVPKKAPFIRTKEAKKISSELEGLQGFVHNGQQEQQQILLVADIKIKNHGYTNKAAIFEKENEFLQLFASEQKPLYIQQLIDLGLQYVFMEGSLKADLLGKNLFSDANEEHLKATSVDFCQSVEFMINAFKRGEDVTIKNKETNIKHTFTAKDYIKKINPLLDKYKPAQLSYTIYPKQYESIATQGSYTKAMQNSGIFKITTKPTSSGIVEMETEKMTGGVPHV